MPPDPNVTVHPDDQVPLPNVVLTIKVYRPRLNPAFLPKVGTANNIIAEQIVLFFVLTIQWFC